MRARLFWILSPILIPAICIRLLCVAVWAAVSVVGECVVEKMKGGGE